MLSVLQVGFCFPCFIIKSFEEVFIYSLIINYIIIYYTIIISNSLDKLANYIKLKIVEG